MDIPQELINKHMEKEVNPSSPRKKLKKSKTKHSLHGKDKDASAKDSHASGKTRPSLPSRSKSKSSMLPLSRSSKRCLIPFPDVFKYRHLAKNAQYPMLFDIEALDNCTFPPYMMDAASHRAYLREIQRRADEEKTLKVKKPKRKPDLGPMWKVQEINLNSWKENTMDYPGLYHFPEELIQDIRKYPQKGRPPSPPEGSALLPDDLSNIQERSYVAGNVKRVSSANQAEMGSFLSQTMGEYNKPKRGPEFNFRYPFYQKAYEEVEEPEFGEKKKVEGEIETEVVTRPQGEQGLKMHRKLLPANQRRQCARPINLSGMQYCDVLGSVACCRCIETVNKKVAHEVQAQDFPRLDCTVTTLIAPRLATVMSVKTKKKLNEDDDDEEEFDMNEYGRCRCGKLVKKKKKENQNGILKFPTLSKGKPSKSKGFRAAFNLTTAKSDPGISTKSAVSWRLNDRMPTIA